ncbi:MAG: hypothetical protein FWB97_00925, partial [Oscillospiraceae bacterium]|nr:hypothetical protein [Oscillospiraceae bacterium]
QGAFPALGDQLGLETIYRRVFAQAPINLRYSLETDIFGRPADRYTLRGQEIVLENRAPAVYFTSAQPFGVAAALSGVGIGPVGTEVPVFVQGTLNYLPEVVRTNPGVNITNVTTAQFDTLDFFTHAHQPSGLAAGGILNLESYNTLNRVPAVGGASGPGNGPLTRAALNGRVQAHTGNGVLVEVFVDEATNYVNTITVIRTDIARIFSSGFFGVTVTPKFADGAASGLPGFGGGIPIRTGTFGSVSSLSAAPGTPHFAALSEFSVGDSALVSFALSSGLWVVGSVDVPELVEGTLTAAVGMTALTMPGSLTVAGRTYPRATILTPYAARATLVAAVPTPTVRMLLDTFGNVVDVLDAPQARNRNILIVTNNGVAPIGGLQGRNVQTVTGFHPDSATTVTINMTARDHIPVQPGGLFPTGTPGAPSFIAVPPTLQAMLNAQGATIGAVIEIFNDPARGNLVNWRYRAGPADIDNYFGVTNSVAPWPLNRGNPVFDGAGVTVGEQLATATPNTFPVATANVVAVSPTVAQHGLVPNQTGLTLADGTHLAFAPDARYFFVTYTNISNTDARWGSSEGVAGVQRIGAVQSLDRNRAIAANANFTATDGAADTHRMVAIVEQRGFNVPPVITALWIGGVAPVQPQPIFENLVFLGGPAPNFPEYLPGNTLHHMRQAWDARGQALPRPPAFQFTEFADGRTLPWGRIPVAANFAPGVPTPGWFTRDATVAPDEFGRFELTAVVAGAPNTFNNVRATTNGLRPQSFGSQTHFIVPFETGAGGAVRREMLVEPGTVVVDPDMAISVMMPMFFPWVPNPAGVSDAMNLYNLVSNAYEVRFSVAFPPGATFSAPSVFITEVIWTPPAP